MKIRKLLSCLFGLGLIASFVQTQAQEEDNCYVIKKTCPN
jgi:hypothetical protein